MRTDAIDLNLAGTNLRVLCDDPTGIAKLRHALTDHLIATRIAPSGSAATAVNVTRSTSSTQLPSIAPATSSHASTRSTRAWPWWGATSQRCSHHRPTPFASERGRSCSMTRPRRWR